jgi:hypothetical protein
LEIIDKIIEIKTAKKKKAEKKLVKKKKLKAQSSN